MCDHTVDRSSTLGVLHVRAVNRAVAHSPRAWPECTSGVKEITIAPMYSIVGGARCDDRIGIPRVLMCWGKCDPATDTWEPHAWTAIGVGLATDARGIMCTGNAFARRRSGMGDVGIGVGVDDPIIRENMDSCGVVGAGDLGGGGVDGASLLLSAPVKIREIQDPFGA